MKIGAHLSVAGRFHNAFSKSSKDKKATVYHRDPGFDKKSPDKKNLDTLKNLLKTSAY